MRNHEGVIDPKQGRQMASVTEISSGRLVCKSLFFAIKTLLRTVARELWINGILGREQIEYSLIMISSKHYMCSR